MSVRGYRPKLVLWSDLELARLERLLNQLPSCEQRELHLGDIALVTHMEYALLLAPMFGVEHALAAYPRVTQWWAWVKGDGAVATGLDEMLTAANAFFGG